LEGWGIMIGKFLARAVYGLIAAACLYSPPAPAQEASTVIGTYCLVGVREVGSCIRLSPGGKFEYFLSYGAYDETAEGTWKLEKGEIVVDSLPYDRPPTFSFKRMEKSETGDFDVIVVSSTDRPIAGIEVKVTCGGTTKDAGVTQADGFKVDCSSAPTAVTLGLSMFGLAPQTIDVVGRAGADKAYVFEFIPGDLGKKKFVAQRLQVGTDRALTMVYADTPIPELNGRRFRYEPER
jgi:hypothetical protein